MGAIRSFLKKKMYQELGPASFNCKVVAKIMSLLQSNAKKEVLYDLLPPFEKSYNNIDCFKFLCYPCS